MRPAAMVSRALAKLQRGFELAVFLDDGLGFDHALEHGVAFALELGVLPRCVPIISGAGDQALAVAVTS